jgi:peptide/nickel transport system ATP-binding protein
MKESEMRKIRWKKISMVFQSSMNALDPVFRIKDQISEAILTHEGIDKLEAEERAKEFLERVGIERSRANDYPHEFSGGMKQRVMIAMALATYPSIVILDEPTSALDVIVQAQILKLIKNLQEEKRLSIILITHDLSVISAVCDRVAIMYAGKIVENSSARTLFKHPQHPYSEGLIGSFPRLSQPRHSRLISISGAPPDLIDPPKGCRFHPRCPRAMEICKREEPVFTETDENHMVACHLYT